MANIKEIIGSKELGLKEFKRANLAFFESFKFYQQLGKKRAILILKYVGITSILSNSKINPFHDTVAKVFRDNPTIA